MKTKNKNDEDKKIEDELKYWMSLTTKQRFEKMFQLSEAAKRKLHNKKKK